MGEPRDCGRGAALCEGHQQLDALEKVPAGNRAALVAGAGGPEPAGVLLRAAGAAAVERSFPQRRKGQTQRRKGQNRQFSSSLPPDKLISAFASLRLPFASLRESVARCVLLCVAVRIAALILFLTVLAASSAVPVGACCCEDRGTGPSSCCVAPTQDDGIEIGCGSSCMPGSARSSGTAERATRVSPPDRDDAGTQPAAASFIAFDSTRYSPIPETPSPPGRPAGRELLSRIAVLRI